MRKLLFLIFCLFSGGLAAQAVDSVAIRQADSLFQASRALIGKKDFDHALELIKQAETVVLEKLGPESVTYGACCYQRSRIFLLSGNIDEGFRWLSQAKAIQEKTIGKLHIDYAKTLYQFGYGYMQLGQYEKAVNYAFEAKFIIEKTEGKTSSWYRGNLNNLAVCYTILGKVEEGEMLFLEARDINGQVGGKESEEYATITSNISHFYLRMGNYKKALEFAQEATELSRKLTGENDPIYANSLKNLASAYGRLGEFQKAEQIYLQASSIYEKALGKDDELFVEILHDLATLYSVTNQYEKSVEFFTEALAKKEKIYGKDNWNYSNTANNFGVLYIEMGAFEKAEPLLLNSLETTENLFGPDNAENLFTLINLAVLYNNQGKYAKSEALHLRTSDIFRKMMANALHHLSEKETRDYLDKFSYFQDCALSTAQVSSPAQPSASSLAANCYDNTLYSKGFLLSAAVRARNLLANDTTNAEQVILLKSVQRRLGDAYSEPTEYRDSAMIVGLETQANDLEKGLARSIAGYADATRNVRWQDVQQHLKPGEAAVEFVRFDYYGRSAQHSTDSIFYAALVLQAGAAQPVFIPLFEIAQLNAALQFEGKPRPAVYNDLYAAGKKGDQLYNLIWKPVAAVLPENTTVYCSATGKLYRLNLGAIPTPDGKTMAEKYRLNIVGSTRQLVAEPTSTQPADNTAQLYGGIQYDATDITTANILYRDADAAPRGFDMVEIDSTLRAENWNYLRWTEVEIKEAAKIMNAKGIATTLKKGADATEESFKNMGKNALSPRILHVSTHGFFFPDPKNNVKLAAGEANAFKMSDQPMIRSGLVLAGANYAWKTGRPSEPDKEDGILTAYEISQMNLSNTELAVLSACETGLGDLYSNEGVYGLQRAFKIAGVRYLIMSLWQVPDLQTQVFMSTFYKHWLEGQMPIPDAFRATQSDMHAKYSDAFVWAGFVLVE
ncbi:MAG: CHAT domain-containing protein [Saprospiraceae bacterium]|nr:CHAT domain-containing protein [Saprospiraceae bacterium]